MSIDNRSMTKPLCLQQVNTIFWLFPGRPQGWRGQGPPRHLTYTLKEWLVLWAPGTPCWHSRPTCPRWFQEAQKNAAKKSCANSIVHEFTWWHDVTIQPRGVTWCHTHNIYICIIIYIYNINYKIYIYINIACCSLIDVFDAETHNIPQQQHSPLQNAVTLTNAAKILFQPELASCGSSCRWNPTRSTKSGTIWPKFNLIVSKLFN